MVYLLEMVRTSYYKQVYHCQPGAPGGMENVTLSEWKASSDVGVTDGITLYATTSDLKEMSG